MNPSPSSSGPSGGRPLTGKQLPLVRAVADPRSDPPESSSSTSLVTSWRLNDAVVGLQLARRQLTSKEFQSDSVTATSSTKMLVSNRFDDRVLRRSTFYKDEIVRKAFGAAATTILTAILLKSSAIPVDQSRTRDSNNETLGAIRSTKTTTAWYSDLPLSVQQQLTATPALPPNNNRNSGRDDGNINIDDSGHSRIRVRTLDQWRTYCLERSYENKEYTKRKGAKIDITSSSSSTPTTTTLRTNVLSKKTMSLPKKSDPKAKQTISTTPHETTSSSPMSIASTATTTTTKSQSGSKRTVQTAPANSSRSPTPASTSSVAADATPSSLSTSVAAPKFTRNTPASSAAALDGRLHTSRAIVCVAANICFDRLTPPFVPNSENDENDSLDLLNVPQNVNTKTITGSTHNAVDQQDDDDDRDPVNMGAVFLDAKILAQRVISTVENAVRRSKLRYQFRKDNARNDSAYPTRLLRESNKNISSYNNSDPVMVNYLKIDNPWSQLARSTVSDESDAENKSMDEEHVQNNNLLCHTAKEEIPYQPNPESITVAWQTLCLPRLLTVLDTGAGHAIYHDVEWSARHGRMADLLRSLSHPSKSDIDGIGDSTENWGPHLIVTTETELTRFAQEFVDYRSDLGLLIRSRTTSPRAMIYHGSKTHRRRLRKYFSKANGLLEAPFHVLITSYNSFVKDYLHFCQVPFETVIVDDGAAWMANKEQNRPSGTMWDMAIFSSNDHGVGLAGTSFKQWDFLEDDVPDAFVKETWIGLTTRHRVVTTSTMTLKQRTSTDCIPVSGLLDFVAPQFFAVVKEDWDRSKISASEPSMAHFRQLVARTMVVHSTDAPDMDLSILASQSLAGDLQSTDGSDIRSDNLVVPVVFSGEDFEEAGSLPFARRNSLLWLGPPKQSWLRYELGRSTFHHILEAMKVSTNFGYFCEEISTASSATTAGVTGQLTGSTAFRFGIRCGRHFGSESGLRQHISAQHAPPGTWLCRTCSSDCTTSQARTHHERTCGQLVLGAICESDEKGETAPTVGPGGNKKGGVGKKTATKTVTVQPGATPSDEKDSDGSFRVPSYRGVWVNKIGKHFIKLNGERYTESKKLILFGSVDSAAKKHDELKLCDENVDKMMELNFKPDGSRIVYDDNSPASASGMGGSVANVVPALSVINIKDLPSDVKPLLRDPRQTSRTGGNSKRHIYAYRGVCRQARKGHDRWQSQISFMGVNHYLGTFDSEWDAAAIYAWAHLILYGEEATKLAQKEGEEAAAAYEQEKRDIAEGRIPGLPAKTATDKKKKAVPKKEKKAETSVEKGNHKSHSGVTDVKTKKRKVSSRDNPNVEKKQRTMTSALKTEKELLLSILAKGVLKAQMLAPRSEFDRMEDSELVDITSRKLKMSRDGLYSTSLGVLHAISAADECIRSCVSATVAPGQVKALVGGAALMGLSPSVFGWDLQDFVESCHLPLEHDVTAALQLLAVEYDDDGVNESFRSAIQGTICVIGSADKVTQQMYNSLGLGSVPLGGCVGKLDCHVGGVPGSCSDMAACIRYAPTGASIFQFSCISDTDVVTLNGNRITPASGIFPLQHEDICSVGARVFAFVMPKDYALVKE